MACFYHLPSTLTNINDISKVDFCYWANTLAKSDDILKIAACYLVSTLTNTDDKAKDLAIHCQAYIYKSGSSLLISYPKLK